jgi:ribonuclease-3
VSESNVKRCQDIIGYRFSKPCRLKQALTHASAAASRIASNERLEFLGDAVLGMVVCQEIFDRAPKLPEGEMTKIKSAVVSRRTCAKIARQLKLRQVLVLGKGVSSRSYLPPSLLAATYEAIIGAVYLDGGVEPARQFILSGMSEVIEASMASRHQKNYKSLLQQHAQRQWNRTPHYVLLDEKGPEHAKAFEVAVRVNGRQYRSAWGNTKKEAEQKAAYEALRTIGVLEETDPEEVTETQ